MARTLPTFDADSMRHIAEHIRRLEMQIGNLERRLVSRAWHLTDPGGGNAVATTDEIIPGRSGTTPGGPIWVQPQKIDDPAAAVPELIDDGPTVKCWSWVDADSSDPASEPDGLLYIFIEQDHNGIWWFTGQNCPPAGG